MLQIVVLAAIAVFLIMRLRNVLGTREGFERPPQPVQPARPAPVAVPAEDSDVLDHAEAGTPAAEALSAMQRAEPSFAVGPFLSGARQAYEMILTAFERGDLSQVRPFLAPAVAEAFGTVAEQFRRAHVVKPIFSREGAGVVITEAGRETGRAPDDSYSHHAMVVQALAPLPVFDGFHPVLGAWIVGESCVGLGVREDRDRITHNLSRFKPHFIEG